MNIQITGWLYRQTLVRVDISRPFVSLSLFRGGVQKVFYFPCFGITKHHLNIFTRWMASIYESFSIQRVWTKGPLTLSGYFILWRTKKYQLVISERHVIERHLLDNWHIKIMFHFICYWLRYFTWERNLLFFCSITPIYLQDGVWSLSVIAFYYD